MTEEEEKEEELLLEQIKKDFREQVLQDQSYYFSLTKNNFMDRLYKDIDNIFYLNIKNKHEVDE